MIMCCCFLILKMSDMQSSSYWYHGFISDGAFATGGKIINISIAFILVCFSMLPHIDFFIGVGFYVRFFSINIYSFKIGDEFL